MGKFLLGLTAALALTAAPAAGQGVGRDARVNLRVEGRALSDVVQYLREQSGANIVVLEGADSNISLELSDVPWRDALEIAAEAADCVVEERTGGILVVERPARVTFESQDTDITQVIDLIAKLGGANIVVAPEVSGTLSLRLQRRAVARRARRGGQDPRLRRGRGEPRHPARGRPGQPAGPDDHQELPAALPAAEEQVQARSSSPSS